MASTDPWKTPIVPPPPGVTSDFDTPSPLIVPGILVPSIYSLLVVLGVGTRMFTKVYVMRKIHPEDYVLVAAAFGSVVWNSLLYNPHTRGGRHVWDYPVAEYPAFLYYVNVITAVGLPAVWLAKWACLAQLARIFAPARHSPLWWAIQALIAIGTLGYSAFLLQTITQCVPREKIWHPQTPGNCGSLLTIFLATSVFNLVLNAAVLGVPGWALWRLKIARRKKVVVYLMFALSCMALFCCIGRAITSYQILHSVDVTKLVVPEASWAVGEVAWVILATCLPTTPRFIKFLRTGSRDSIPPPRYTIQGPPYDADVERGENRTSADLADCSHDGRRLTPNQRRRQARGSTLDDIAWPESDSSSGDEEGSVVGVTPAGSWVPLRRTMRSAEWLAARRRGRERLTEDDRQPNSWPLVEVRATDARMNGGKRVVDL